MSLCLLGIFIVTSTAYAYTRGAGFAEGDAFINKDHVDFDERNEDTDDVEIDHIKLYAKDNSGTTALYTIDDTLNVDRICVDDDTDCGYSLPADVTFTHIDVQFISDGDATFSTLIVNNQNVCLKDGTDCPPGSQNLFETISTPSGTSPVADSTTDTLTFLEGANITITGDSTADSITIASTASGGNTLDEAYDEGGAGAGRTITADAGDFQVNGGSTITDGTFTNTLQSPKIGNISPGDATFTAVHVTPGNVGIGTTSPSQLVHLQANLPAILLTTGGGASTAVEIKNTISGSPRGAIDLWSSTKDISLNSGGLNSYFDSGNLGVGVTVPNRKLHIDGAMTSRDATFTTLSSTDATFTRIGDTSPGDASFTNVQVDSTQVCLEDGTDCPAGATDQNLFETINAPSGTDPVADLATDTLNLSNGTGISITGNSGTDTITIASTVTDTNLTQEEVEDFAGGLVANGTGTHTDITITYQDASNDIDFVVDTLPNLTGTLDVNSGGTGATSLTDGGILLGSGTGAITALGVATNGQIPIGDGTTDPQLATITGDDGITVTNGAGSIELDVTPLASGSNGDSTTAQSDSGLEIVSNELTLLRGCADNQILKWDETQDEWKCEADAGASTGDDVSVDGADVTDPDFVSTGQIDFTDSSNTITADINDDSILEADLKAVNAAVDEDILTYESTTGDYEWHTPSELITAGDNISWTGTTLNVTAHTTDTNANTICSGTSVYLDGEGNCDTLVTNTDQNIFETINASSGTDPVADSTTDTLNVTGGTGITVTGDSSTDTLTIATTITDTNANTECSGTSTYLDGEGNCDTLSLSGNTLDQAYDEGGAGAGRIINADSGALEIQTTGLISPEGTFTQLQADRIGDISAGDGTFNVIDVDTIKNHTSNQDINIIANDGGVFFSALYVDASTKNIGIGATTPSQKLEVVGSNLLLDSTSAAFFQADGAAFDAGVAYLNDGTTYWYTMNDHSESNDFVIRDVDGSVDALVIDATTQGMTALDATFTNVGISGLTANKCVETDGNKILRSSDSDCGGSSEWTDLSPTENYVYTTDSGGTQDGVLIGDNDSTNADIVLDVGGGATFNKQGADADFIVESTTDANMIRVDASEDRVCIGCATPVATLDVDGGFATSIVEFNDGMDHTIDETNHTVLCDASTDAFTVNIPDAATVTGIWYHFKVIDSSGNGCTVDPAGSDNIDGATTKTISTQYDSFTIQSDGTQYWVID